MSLKTAEKRRLQLLPMIIREIHRIALRQLRETVETVDKGDGLGLPPHSIPRILWIFKH
jgi:hypothetical protein